MKKVIMISLLAILLNVIFNQTTQAQKTTLFQGTVTYGISIVGTVEAAIASQIPKTSTVTIKDMKTKTETAQGPVIITEMVDASTKKYNLLLDMPTGKYVIAMTGDSIQKKIKNKMSSTIKLIDSTKTIAGYVCKKAIITFKDAVDGTETVESVYYTDEIGGKEINFNSEYYLVPGFLMEYNKNAGSDIVLAYSVSVIKKGKVSDKIFLVPADYKELDAAAAQKMFGGE